MSFPGTVNEYCAIILNGLQFYLTNRDREREREMFKRILVLFELKEKYYQSLLHINLTWNRGECSKVQHAFANINQHARRNYSMLPLQNSFIFNAHELPYEISLERIQEDM